mgnify:CR=1 FL=1
MEKHYQTENNEELYGFNDYEDEYDCYEYDNFLPHFCEVPPFAFINGVSDAIRAERENLLLRLCELEKKRESVLGRIMGESKADAGERRQIAAKQYKLISCLQDAVAAEEDALKRRTFFLDKTGMLYAECICFACGYAIYLDDDGELFAAEITESSESGDVRGEETYLCPISALSYEDRADVERIVDELPFAWVSKSKLRKEFFL